MAEVKDEWLEESISYVKHLIGDGPDCLKCVHYQGGGECMAFPNGIPKDILVDASNHLKPVEGDYGIVYEELEELLGIA